MFCLCRTDDDGSSQYNATHNFLVYGAFKVRDGINRAHSHNLIYGKPADYQCDGFNSTTMEYNTVKEWRFLDLLRCQSR